MWNATRESVHSAHKQARASASWESLSAIIMITAKYCHTTSYRTRQYSNFSQAWWSLQDCQSGSFGYNQCRGYCLLVKIGDAHVQPHTTAMNCSLFFFDFTDHEDPWEAGTIMMVTIDIAKIDVSVTCRCDPLVPQKTNRQFWVTWTDSCSIKPFVIHALVRDNGP